MFAGPVAAIGADTERRRDRKIRQFEFLANDLYQLFEPFNIMDPLSDKPMEDRPSGIFRLQAVLMLQHLKNILRIIHRKMG